VKAFFGSLDGVSYTDGGNEIWKYSFAKVELNILFKNDTVQKYTMAESAINTKSGWAD